MIDLGQQLEGMRLLLERSLREDITTRLEIEPGLWPVEVDPSQLELAVLNIAVNARDAMTDGGTITLVARNRPGLTVEDHTGDFVELSVIDTGVGMTEEEIGKALQPFGQIQNHMTAKHNGTGLGLPLAKAMMELHGGTLEISSVPDLGTTVLLNFPAARISAGAAAAAA